ncbi:Dihydrolipoamide acetyltransferase component of pyruvate dehydrogenase complex [Desulfurella amilsii]|uniref:Dihydrolipoamide acetyltransferase component of pyruvate dehydrogenase complex n=1 Tax=Desulfurella amilsii TaxID=1562698 RepID=A0A1X4XYH1_9BACT|nr:dihydrolipoamide acetyltransferase family protein [Desulfurella amilsii]OSS42575.1 Dihydrolipoamide acetyltransferase component of pyruvate dehydrogenase complex [Desulfurella amilsii]
MKADIIMPKIGLSNKPLTIVEWKFKEGDLVKKGGIVVTVETEKIRYDVEAPIEGYLHIIAQEKQEVEIGSAIGVLTETIKEYEESKSITLNKQVQSPQEVFISKKSEFVKEKEERIKISPIARKLAEEHMVDITQVKGSGPDGRIVKEDIEAFLKNKETSYDGRKIKEVIPFTGTRKAIAEHMHASLSNSAQITLMGEIDAYELVNLREQLLNKESELGLRITYTDLLVYFISRVLKDFSLINSSIIDNEIKVWEDINIGVAVALEDGLIVPAIKNADKKTLIEISKNLKELSAKARERKLEISDVKGSTFSLTNLGAFGGGYRFETVVINQPESAILGTGGIVDRPVVINKQIVVRPIMTYYLTYDHRVVDGALAAKFINKVKEVLENANEIYGGKL